VPGVSGALQTPKLGGNGEIDHLMPFPGPVEVAISLAISSSHAADTQSPFQPVGKCSGLSNAPEMGGNFNNAVSGGFPDMSSPMSTVTPPFHTRPLYHSIELPEFDDDEPQFGPKEITLNPAGCPILAGSSPPPGTARLSPPANEPAVLEFALQVNALGLYTDTPHLHDMVQRALFDPSFSLHPLDPSVARQLWDPATDFDVRGLSILFIESGMTVIIGPSMTNGGVVRVGDVLRVLKTAPAGSEVKNGTRVGVTVKGYY